MKAKQFIKNTLAYCIPSIVSAILGILVIPIITSFYPEAEYGRINLFYSIANTVSMFAMFGMDSAFLRFYHEPPKGFDKNTLFQASIVVSVTTSVVSFLLVTCFWRNECEFYLFGIVNSNLWYLFLLYVIGIILIRFAGYELRMQQKPIQYSINQMLLMFANRIFFVVFVGYSTSAFFANMVTAVFTFVIGLLYFLFRENKNSSMLSVQILHSKEFAEIIKFGFPLMLTVVMVWLNNYVGSYVFSFYSDYNAVGVFSIGTSVANLFSIVPAAFTTYWAPFVYKNYQKEQRFISNVHDWIVIGTTLFFILFFVFQDIIYHFIGANYRESQAFFLILMINPAVALVSETTVYGIMLKNKTQYNTWISLLTFVLNVLITFFGYKTSGLIGASFGVLISSLVQMVIKTFIAQKYYKTINKPIKTGYNIVLLILISIINIFVYDRIYVRLSFAFVVLAFSMLIYKDEMGMLNSLIGRKMLSAKEKIYDR